MKTEGYEKLKNSIEMDLFDCPTMTGIELRTYISELNMLHARRNPPGATDDEIELIAKEIEANELKINEEFGLDNYTMPNNDFPDPYMTCCFISDDEIFVNFFHNYTKTHCHFVWNHVKR